MDTAAVRAQAISALAPPFRSESILWLLVELDRVRGERDRAVDLAVGLSLRTGRALTLADARSQAISAMSAGRPPDAGLAAALAAHDRRSAG